MNQSTNRGNPRERTRRRGRTSASLAVETLEGRQLLSHVAHAARLPVHGGFPQGTPEAVLLYSHPGPILNRVGLGYAFKDPRFYPFYTGSIRAELNTAASTAVVRNGGTTLNLTGEVAGQLVTTPQTNAQGSIYIFGINRGGATGPGPFPDRPKINFDAAVVVQITPSGTSAYVTSFGPGATKTALPSSSVQLVADTVKVQVPLALLPATGPGGAGNYSVVFWAANPAVTSGGSGSAIASFTPEFRTYPVRIARG